MSRVVTVLQARVGSTRLPGKVLLPLGGRPALERLAERVRRARRAGTVVIATTTASEDAVLETVAARAGVLCFRGHPTDLLDRHYQVARMLGATHVVKVPSDCVLIDGQVIDRVIEAFFARPGAFDYVSNLHPESYPDGNDVEICTVAALERAWSEAVRPLDREHTTPYLWDHPETFRIGNVAWETGRDLSRSHRIVLDYPDDWEVIRRVFDALYPRDPAFGLPDVVRYLDNHPEVRELNARYRGVHWYRHHLDELRTVSAEDTCLVPGESR